LKTSNDYKHLLATRHKIAVFHTEYTSFYYHKSHFTGVCPLKQLKV